MSFLQRRILYTHMLSLRGTIEFIIYASMLLMMEGISQAHSQCTESFYRKAVEDQIRSEPSQSAEEKRKMLEMLKRLEADSLDVTAEDNSDGDDDGGQDGPDASLEVRLAGLDIGMSTTG